MGLEDFIPDEDIDSGSKGAEISEKFKEAFKKSSAKAKKAQKDEKKAKKFDLLLASFLKEIIKNPKYDFLLDDFFKTLDAGFSSNFLLGIISLIYLPISDKIRELSKKDIINFNYVKTFEIIDFDDDNLDDEIKKRINFWLEDILDIISIEYSSLQITKLKKLFNKRNIYNQLVLFVGVIFRFFFEELNIKITLKKSKSYVNFILSQVYKELQEIKEEEV